MNTQKLSRLKNESSIVANNLSHIYFEIKNQTYRKIKRSVLKLIFEISKLNIEQ
jgi:uncharacterized protein (UPF0335 family)